ncbi:MAG TPA: hypothetical protein VNN20_12530 [Thermodesulfobacteriota bacterium]|nr:hypothetical protein [Thermodesulfobacteriota bacterium]
MNGNGMKSITDLEERIVDSKKRYSKFLEERERRRKREHDVHFSKKDQQILIKSFVIAGVIENGLRKIFVNIL